MEKLVLIFAAIAAILFAFCGNKTPQTKAAVGSLEAIADSVADLAMEAAGPTAAAAVDSVTGTVDSVA